MRQISTGIIKLNFNGKNVGLVDERGEIAAMYKGASQNDIGLRTDVLENIPKGIGMRMLIRSMAPNIIAADEIGTNEDVEAIKYAVCSGVKGIFTVHGKNLEEMYINPIIKSLMELQIIEKIVILKDSENKGAIDKVYKLNKENKRYIEETYI